MKVLRIYDHLGELKKEFNVYVEGEDFKWQASYPEVVWLGTITLEVAGKEPEKPSETLAETLERIKQAEILEEKAAEVRVELEEKLESEKPPTIIRYPEEKTFVVTEPEPEVDEAKVSICDAMRDAVKAKDERKEEEEVKDEPKKVHRKRRTVKGSSPSNRAKSLKVLRQDDPGRDTNQGD